MALIKSISGIRGTIGGKSGEGFTPLDIVKFTAAFGTWLQLQSTINPEKSGQKSKIVIGRDARISGEMVRNLVTGTLQGLGIDVVDLGLSTTPTVEIAVVEEKANGGIILTASHNPKQWNALKLLNEKGEFISAKDGEDVLKIAEQESFVFADVNKLGRYKTNDTYIQKHIDKILALDLVDCKAIKARNFKVVIDCVNSTGGIAVPKLLKALGVTDIIELYTEPNGQFPHNPEPLPENLRDISKEVVKKKAHLGIVVDPDVDRLALICEDGEMFGEEYTLVSVADYVLKCLSPALSKGEGANTVSNLSSTRALRDVTEKAGGKYFASAVGEVNVVTMMKLHNAVIGGEGNGGIIYPELHYGRDSLVGIALFLSHLAKFGKSTSMLRAQYPDYHISKNKIELTPKINIDNILKSIADKYKNYEINTTDGLKIDFSTSNIHEKSGLRSAQQSNIKHQTSNIKDWVHLRKSNTEPIIRIYAESQSETTAENLAEKIISDIKELMNWK